MIVMEDMFYNLTPDSTALIESIDVECYFMSDLGDDSETEYARALKVITHDTAILGWGLPMRLRLEAPRISYWVNKSIYTFDPDRLSIMVNHTCCDYGMYHVKRLNCKAGIVIKDHDDMVCYFFSDFEGTRRLRLEINRRNCNR
jgi:hypothetical protein